MRLFYINILIFNFRCLLHVLNLRVHLQEDGCIYRYGIVCFTYIGISRHVGRSRQRKGAFCWFIMYKCKTLCISHVCLSWNNNHLFAGRKHWFWSCLQRSVQSKVVMRLFCQHSITLRKCAMRLVASTPLWTSLLTTKSSIQILW